MTRVLGTCQGRVRRNCYSRWVEGNDRTYEGKDFSFNRCARRDVDRFIDNDGALPPITKISCSRPLRNPKQVAHRSTVRRALRDSA